MAVAYKERPSLICHPRIYFILYLPSSWVSIACIPCSPILTSTNGGKPPYQYKWSWTSLRVTGDTIIFTCITKVFARARGFCTISVYQYIVLSVLLNSTSQFFAHENKDLNVFSHKLISLYRQETNTLHCTKNWICSFCDSYQR